MGDSPEGFKTRLVHAEQRRDIDLVGLDRDRLTPICYGLGEATVKEGFGVP